MVELVYYESISIYMQVMKSQSVSENEAFITWYIHKHTSKMLICGLIF